VALILTCVQREAISASEAKVAQERMTAVELGRFIMATIALNMSLRRVLWSSQFGRFGGYKGYGRHGHY
jgi:hypothetical protein